MKFKFHVFYLISIEIQINVFNFPLMEKRNINNIEQRHKKRKTNINLNVFQCLRKY